MSNFNVQDFLKTLENSKPQANNSQFSGRSPLEKVYLNFPENYGKYQIFPNELNCHRISIHSPE